MNQPMNSVALATSNHSAASERYAGDFSNARIAWIEACWHQEIVSQARIAFSAKMQEHGVTQDQIYLNEVPGRLEIPLQAKLLAASGNFDVIICAGLIVNGGIYRHDFVAGTVLDAMMQVSLDAELPVLSVVLTPLNFHESQEHHDFFFNHFLKKGEEAAYACLHSLNNMRKLGKQQHV